MAPNGAPLLYPRPLFNMIVWLLPSRAQGWRVLLPYPLELAGLVTYSDQQNKAELTVCQSEPRPKGICLLLLTPLEPCSTAMKPIQGWSAIGQENQRLKDEATPPSPQPTQQLTQIHEQPQPRTAHPSPAQTVDLSDHELSK